MTAPARIAKSLLAVAFWSGAARADDCPCPAVNPCQAEPTLEGMPFAYPKFVRTLAGIGGAPRVGSYSAVLTSEIGGHPLGGAFATGPSFTSVGDFTGRYTLVTVGLFTKLDLTYLFLSGMWATKPDPFFPFRLLFGSRFGVTLSDSFGQNGPPSYVLARTELQGFFDVEVPLPPERIYSIVVRTALDTAVNLSDVFRWSVSVGVNFGWGNG